MEKRCIQRLFYDLEQTTRVCRLYCEDYFCKNVKSNLSFDEFIILETIISNTGICQRDLSKLILKGASHTSKLLVCLELKGFIKRVLNIKNNRIVKFVELTDAGKCAYQEAKSVVEVYAKKIEDIVGEDDARICSAIMHKIKDAMM